MITLGALAIVLLCLLFGIPLYILVGSLGAYFYHFVSEENLKIIIGDIFFAADKEILLAIPLFVLAGQIMTKGSMSQRLVDLAKVLTKNIPGGLGIAAILSCALFAAISGSSPVTLIAIGSILFPALVASGYDKKTSMGLLTASGTLGIIIPPSIPMIIFAIMGNVSVVALFKSGIGPGILLILILIPYVIWKAPKGLALQVQDQLEFWPVLKRGFFSVLMPVVILGGIYSGVFTATESAAVAVLYACLVEFFIHREMKLANMGAILTETLELMGQLFLILIFAVSLNKFMTYEEIPALLVDFITSSVDSKISFLILVNLLLLVVGCIMDIMSAILVLAPLLTPMAAQYGIDPVHFGIIMIVNLEIGYITPPLGINIFVASSIFNHKIGQVIKSVLPFVLILTLGLVLVTFVPEISLFWR
jgi:C4-dicarboxylate transporter DctM subunit